MGWHIHPGGYWSGDYIVAPVADFEADAGGNIASNRERLRFFRVKEVLEWDPLAEPKFPLKEARERRETSVSQIAERVSPQLIGDVGEPEEESTGDLAPVPLPQIVNGEPSKEEDAKAVTSCDAPDAEAYSPAGSEPDEPPPDKQLSPPMDPVQGGEPAPVIH